jgi:hypothetical protein
MTNVLSMDTHSTKPVELTSQVVLDLQGLPPGQPVAIAERSSFVGNLYVSLTVPALNAVEEDMRLWWCLFHKDEYYCLIAHRDSRDEDQSKTMLMVLKVANENTLVTLTDAEFEQVAPACKLALADWSHVKEADVSALLGSFPEVDV